MLATYMRRIRNNNLRIRIAGILVLVLSVAVIARQKVVFAQGTTGFPWFYIAEIASVYLHVSRLTMQYQREKSPNKAEQHNYLDVLNEMQGGFPFYVKNVSASLLSI